MVLKRRKIATGQRPCDLLKDIESDEDKDCDSAHFGVSSRTLRPENAGPG
jgi:hypothetical protein